MSFGQANKENRATMTKNISQGTTVRTIYEYIYMSSILNPPCHQLFAPQCPPPQDYLP
jgi:hypothetical protein